VGCGLNPYAICVLCGYKPTWNHVQRMKIIFDGIVLDLSLGLVETRRLSWAQDIIGMDYPRQSFQE